MIDAEVLHPDIELSSGGCRPRSRQSPRPVGDDLAGLGVGLEQAQPLEHDGLPLIRSLKRVQVLGHEQRPRHQHHHLLAVLRGLEQRRVRRSRSCRRRDVAADRVHRDGRHHVALDLVDRGSARPGLVEREHVLEVSRCHGVSRSRSSPSWPGGRRTVAVSGGGTQACGCAVSSAWSSRHRQGGPATSDSPPKRPRHLVERVRGTYSLSAGQAGFDAPYSSTRYLAHRSPRPPAASSRRSGRRRAARRRRSRRRAARAGKYASCGGPASVACRGWRPSARTGPGGRPPSRLRSSTKPSVAAPQVIVTTQASVRSEPVATSSTTRAARSCSAGRRIRSAGP